MDMNSLQVNESFLLYEMRSQKDKQEHTEKTVFHMALPEWSQTTPEITAQINIKEWPSS